MDDTAPLNPFSPILPVPQDGASDGAQPLSAPRDWGDVHDDVMEMFKLYNMLVERLMEGSGELRSLGSLTAYLEQVERRLGITWDGMVPNASSRPRRAQYRVC